MSIASEISRLQSAKSSIKTAIENKGVTVGSSLKLDDYDDCINAIQTGAIGGNAVEVLVVGGGGAGGNLGTTFSSYSYGGGGGGAGGLKHFVCHMADGEIANVIVGKNGRYEMRGCCVLIDGGCSSFGSTTVGYGGFGGGRTGLCICEDCCHGGNGASGGGGRYEYKCSASGYYTITKGGENISGQGNKGGSVLSVYALGGGGGGAGGAGVDSHNPSNDTYNTECSTNGYGGAGYMTDISGTMACYAGGGGGGGASYGGCGSYGGGNGGYCCTHSTAATTCGSGGGGSSGYCCKGGSNGGCGIVYVRYKTGSICATGGCKYTCGDYTIHRFNDYGQFVVNPSGCHISYLVVGGGGGGGLSGGGGGGAVCFGAMPISTNSISVTVGSGGTGSSSGSNGGLSKIVVGNTTIQANGGYGGKYYTTITGTTYSNGGNSGNGCTGGNGNTCRCADCTGGGGGGAGGNGWDGPYPCCGAGGKGLLGYGGGGGGGHSNNIIGTPGYDGGGWGMCNCKSYANATNYGGGGGGTRYQAACAGNGCQGVVDICYPADGSYGFTNATGGTKTLINGMCRHRFTSSGTFTIVS